MKADGMEKSAFGCFGFIFSIHKIIYTANAYNSSVYIIFDHTKEIYPNCTYSRRVEIFIGNKHVFCNRRLYFSAD